MFSIKWIAGNGAEMVYPARNISFTPFGQSNGTRDAEPSKAAVSFETDDGHCTIDSGRVYVMNDNGKTIARYILKSDKEFPHGLAEPHGLGLVE